MQSCIICNSYKIKEYKNLFICKKCGFYQNKIRKSSLEIESYYDKYFEMQRIIDMSKSSIYYKIKKFLIKRYKTTKIKVLEVGFGSGYFLKYLQNIGYDVYGVELVKRSVESAKTLIGEDKIYLGDFLHIKFPLKFFDVIILIDVLYEINDINKAIKYINEILTENGILIIRVKNALFHIYLEKLINIVKLFIKSPFVYHNFGFTFRSLKWLLLKNGFRILNNKAYLYLTLGDPYRQLKFLNEIVSIFKCLYFIISKIVYFFTGFIISPSFIIYSVKK
ncbi:MAG: class I SAM-dependent methyltransferase [Elusimicrobiota bacterium]|nr:class I SAM-dependent methyltransferase [Endomicrobiia bacterium]MDW8165354.1 class I SAM-dependent methyltransferase [Elusimicrobiota bacterium]